MIVEYQNVNTAGRRKRVCQFMIARYLNEFRPPQLITSFKIDYITLCAHMRTYILFHIIQYILNYD